MEPMEMTKSILRNNLKILRKERGWNQEDLAEKSGYSAGFVADVERGKSWVSPEAIEAFAAALGVDIGRLFVAEAPARESMPMSRVATRIGSVPDRVYELAEKLGRNSAAWKVVIGALEEEEEAQLKAKAKRASQSQG